MANIKLRITGMTCGHCQAKVEKALKSVSGVYSAVIDLPDGEAEVDFDDDATTVQALISGQVDVIGAASTQLSNIEQVAGPGKFDQKFVVARAYNAFAVRPIGTRSRDSSSVSASPSSIRSPSRAFSRIAATANACRVPLSSRKAPVKPQPPRR